MDEGDGGSEKKVNGEGVELDEGEGGREEGREGGPEVKRVESGMRGPGIEY